MVDDALTIRVVMERTLRRAGFEPLSAGDGQEALAILDRRAREGERLPDVIVTDARMPGTSGMELYAAVRDRFGGIPVLVISGALHEVLEGAPMDDTRLAFLAKPFELAELARRVAALAA